MTKLEYKVKFSVNHTKINNGFFLNHVSIYISSLAVCIPAQINILIMTLNITKPGIILYTRHYSKWFMYIYSFSNPINPTARIIFTTSQLKKLRHQKNKPYLSLHI